MINEQKALEEILDIQNRIDRLEEEIDGLKGEKKKIIRQFNAPLIQRMERTLKRFLEKANKFYGCTEFDITDADIHVETGEYEDCNYCGYEGELVYHAYGLAIDKDSGKVVILFNHSCGPNYDWGSHREMFSETRLSTIKQIAKYLGEAEGVGLMDAAGKIIFSRDKDYYRHRIDLLAETIVIPSDVKEIESFAYQDFPILKRVIVPDGVTSIGWDAFRGCHALEEIDLPDSVSEIGSSTFEDCKRLKVIRLPSGLSSINYNLFEGCSRLSTVSIPDGVTEIEKNAFCGCSALGEIHLPESLTMIKGHAFLNCRSLKEVFIPSHVEEIGDMWRSCKNAFAGCSKLEEMIVSPDNPTFDSREGCHAIINTASNTLIAGCKNTFIPDSVTGIGPSAFEGCFCPEQLYIPDSVTEIGHDAFKDCSGLRIIYVLRGTDLTDAGLPNGVRVFERAVNPENNAEIKVKISGHDGLITMHLPDSNTIIGERVLYNCSGVKDIHIPESVTEIGESALEGCIGMKTIHIPENVSAIEDCAFAHNRLIEMTVSPANRRYDSRENCNAIIESATNTLIAGCKKTIIPDSIVKIGDVAFCECFGLTESFIPEGVTEIGNGAFYGCSELKEIHMPEGLTKIGVNAFYRCASLTHLQIPRSVTEIGKDAFKHCSGLLSVLAPKGLDLKTASVPRGVKVRRYSVKTNK